MQDAQGPEEKKTAGGSYCPARQKANVIHEYLRISVLRFVRNRTIEDSEEQEDIDPFPYDGIEDKQWFAEACYDKLSGHEDIFPRDLIEDFIIYTVGKVYTSSSAVTAIRQMPKAQTEIHINKSLEVSRFAELFIANMSPLCANLTTACIKRGAREIDLGEGLWDAAAYALSDSRACHFFTVHSEFIPLNIRRILVQAGLKPKPRDRQRRKKILAFINSREEVKSVLENILVKLITDSEDKVDLDLSSDNLNELDLSSFDLYMLRNIRWKSEQSINQKEQSLSSTQDDGEPFRAISGDRRNAHSGMRYDEGGEEAEQAALCHRLYEATIPIISPVVQLTMSAAYWWRKQVIENRKKSIWNLKNPREKENTFTEYVAHRYILYADVFEIYAHLLQESVLHLLQVQFCEQNGHSVVFRDPERKHSKLTFKISRREAAFVPPRLLDLVSNQEIMTRGRLLCDTKEDIFRHAERFGELRGYAGIASWLSKNIRFGGEQIPVGFIAATLIGGRGAREMLLADTAKDLKEHCRWRGKTVGRQHLPKDLMKHRIVSALPHLLSIVNADREKYDFEVCNAFFSFIGVAPGLANPTGKDIVLKPDDRKHEREEKMRQLAGERKHDIIRENGVRWKKTNRLLSTKDGKKPIYEPMLHGMGTSVAAVITGTNDVANLTNTEIYYRIVAVEMPQVLQMTLEDCGRYAKDKRYKPEYGFSDDGTWVKHRKPVRARQPTRHVKI